MRLVRQRKAQAVDQVDGAGSEPGSCLRPASAGFVETRRRLLETVCGHDKSPQRDAAAAGF